MRLWHSTDQRGRDRIAADGFQHEDPPAGPSWTAEDRDYFWWAISKEVALQTVNKTGWWVIIEVPDDTPEYELTPGETYPGVYRLSGHYLNSLPLVFEQA